MNSKDSKKGMNPKIFKTKNIEETRRPTRLAKLPKRHEFQSSLKNSNESGRHRNGFSKSVYESVGILTPKKLGYPTENHLQEWHKTRSSIPYDLSSLKIGGRGFPRRISSLEGDDVSSGLKSLAEGREKDEIIVKLPSNLSDSSSESSKELTLPSLPSIPTSNEVPREKNFGRKKTSKLSTNLNLIESRRKSKTFQRPKKPEKHFFEGSDGVDGISRIQLETQLSLPKITIDEVLKSWDIQPRATRRKRASSNASTKHDPMEFLTQRKADFENVQSLHENFSSCYEDVKSCRYLRIGKEEEEEGILHGRNCPCNSCEHGEALRESPYLNA